MENNNYENNSMHEKSNKPETNHTKTNSSNDHKEKQFNKDFNNDEKQKTNHFHANKKHINPQQDNKNDKKQPQFNKNDKHHQFTSEIENLNKRIRELEQTLILKNNKIKDQETTIQNLNDSFKKQIETKTLEAQQLINKKITELQNKFDSETKLIKKYALQNNAIELISIINQFDRVVNSPATINDPKIQGYLSGFKMFLELFQNLLANMNIVQLDVKVGDKFNHNFMNGIEISEDPNIASGCVAKVFNKGYRLHDRVIVHAEVSVKK